MSRTSPLKPSRTRTRKARPSPPASATDGPAFEATDSPDAEPTPDPAVEPTKRTPKLEQLVAHLRRPEGATVAQLAEALGWQAHSVRGAMAGALKARGHVVSSEKIDGPRVYRLPSPVAAEAAVVEEAAS